MMIGLSTITALMAKHGLAVLAPIAVLEGPIITVIAAWLASQGIMNLWAVIFVVVAADLVGDVGIYSFGRWGVRRLPEHFLTSIGLSRERLEALVGQFQDHGGRILVFGKFTQSAGIPVLVAAGLAKMPLRRLVFVNFLATVPKSLVFVALGYAFGSAYASIDNWLTKISLLFGAVIVAVAIGALVRRILRQREKL